MSSDATTVTASTLLAESTTAARWLGLSSLAMSDFKGLSMHFIFSSVVFLVVTVQAIRYYSLTKDIQQRRESSRIVTCLWLLNAIHYIWVCHQAFVLPNMQWEFDLLMMSALTLTFCAVVVYIGVSIFMWRKLRIMTASRLYASLLVLVPWFPVTGYKFFLTHVSAITPIGLSGVVHALIAPRNAAPSQCPRLRIPFGLAVNLQSNATRRRKYIYASGLIAANGFILWLLSKLRLTGKNHLPGGMPYESRYGLGDIYTVVYLAIRLRNASTGKKPIASVKVIPEVVTAHSTGRESPVAELRSKGSIPLAGGGKDAQ